MNEPTTEEIDKIAGQMMCCSKGDDTISHRKQLLLFRDAAKFHLTQTAALTRQLDEARKALEVKSKLEALGLDVWNDLKSRYPEFADEDDEDTMERAGKCGLARRVVYSEAKHGHIEDVQEGEEIWFWGDEKTTEGTKP